MTRIRPFLEGGRRGTIPLGCFLCAACGGGELLCGFVDVAESEMDMTRIRPLRAWAAAKAACNRLVFVRPTFARVTRI